MAATEETAVRAPSWLRAVNAVVAIILWTIVTAITGFAALMFRATVMHLTCQPAIRSARLAMERREADIEHVIAADDAKAGAEISADLHESRIP